MNTESATPYHELPGLEHLYLEDSYVLDITVLEATLRIRMLFVLTEDHAEYQPPPATDQYCYRYGELAFPELSSLRWERSGSAPNVDPGGEPDLGNIDSLRRVDGRYELEGEWGFLSVASAAPTVTLDPVEDGR